MFCTIRRREHIFLIKGTDSGISLVLEVAEEGQHFLDTRLRPVDVVAYMATSLLQVAVAPWSVAEWAVAPRFDKPRATVLVRLLSDTP